MKRLIMVCAVLFLAGTVDAQTGVPTSYVLKIYPAGGATASSAVTVPVASVSCNQAPVTGLPNLNPTQWRWNDPAIAGRDCAYVDTARLIALADGNYEGTAAAANADGTSAESARVPFVRRRANPPGAVMGLRISQ